MNTYFQKKYLPDSLTFLSPIIVNNLIRLGRSNDGGYIIPADVVQEADFLVSFGISNDWSFEENFLELNPNLTIHGYDHTVSLKIFMRDLLHGIKSLFLLRISTKKIFRKFAILYRYKKFFKKNVTHFVERVHNRIDHHNDVTPEIIFNRLNGKNIFFKIDIEGSEYRIIDQLVSFYPRIIGMVIEFHETDPLRLVFLNSINKLLKNFDIVHIHGNNYGSISNDGLPEALEITLIRKNKYPSSSRRKFLPIPQLDQPNNPMLVDYDLKFR